MRTKWIFLLFSICMFPVLLGAQTEDTIVVHLKARVTENSVKLRWVVEKPHLWEKMNRKGFIIERYSETGKGNEKTDGMEKKQLTPYPLKPAPLGDWETLASRNNYAAVIAQAIYGDDFEVGGFNTGTIADAMQLSRQSEQRYAFALYAADMCFEAACLAGWGYEDKDVKPGECYLYRIIPVEIGDQSFLYGFDYVCMDEYQLLPPPLDLKAEFGDKTAALSWNGNLMNPFFTSYQVEKSEDNHHFESLSMPVTSLDEGGENYLNFVDSLDENGKTYYYRIRGISPFGEISQPSDTVQGQGKPVLKFYPRITRSIIDESGTAQIEWEFDPEGEPYVDSFSLERSDHGNGTYETVVTSIEKGKRIVITDHVLSSNYFVIAAVSSEKTVHRSYPVLLMPVDSVSPLPPDGLTASIDTLGVVRLQWNPNQEPDLLGYKVFRSFREGDEPVSMNEEPAGMTFFTDTVDLQQLNEWVCYRLVAFDRHYNQSTPSPLLKVKKPLMVKPAPPVLDHYQSGEDGILLTWINNPDEWVDSHRLYRQHRDSIAPVLIKEFFGQSESVFIDSLVERGVAYTYTLTALSRWGKESDPCPGICVVASPGGKTWNITEFRIKREQKEKQVVLSWKAIQPQKIAFFRIYRSSGETPVSLWKKLPGTAFSVTDASLQVGIKYKYMIYAVLEDGSISETRENTFTY